MTLQLRPVSETEKSVISAALRAVAVRGGQRVLLLHCDATIIHHRLCYSRSSTCAVMHTFKWPRWFPKEQWGHWALQLVDEATTPTRQPDASGNEAKAEGEFLWLFILFRMRNICYHDGNAAGSHSPCWLEICRQRRKWRWQCSVWRECTFEVFQQCVAQSSTPDSRGLQSPTEYRTL